MSGYFITATETSCTGLTIRRKTYCGVLVCLFVALGVGWVHYECDRLERRLECVTFMYMGENTVIFQACGWHPDMKSSVRPS